MYITITPQKLTDSYSQSVSEFVAYLEKENEDKSMDAMEHFFNQYENGISEIDKNTHKLKKIEP